MGSHWDPVSCQYYSLLITEVLLLVTPKGLKSCWQRETHHPSHIYAFQVSELSCPPFIALEVPGASLPGLCVSLLGVEGSHKAEGKPVAPQNYPCRSTTVGAEPSGSKTDKDKKKRGLLTQAFIQGEKESCLLVVASSSASLF